MFWKKKKDPKKAITKITAKLRDQQSVLRKEKRQIDRRIFAIKDEEDKAKQTISQMSKKGLGDRCRQLAVSVVDGRKTISRLETAKLDIDATDQQLERLRGDMRLSRSVEASYEVMTGMTKLIQVPELAKTMKKTAKELYKLGILEEKIDAATEIDRDEDEENVEEEISKVLAEATLDQAGERQPFRSVSVEVSSKTDRPTASNDRNFRSLSVGEKKSHTSDEGRRLEPTHAA